MSIGAVAPRPERNRPYTTILRSQKFAREPEVLCSLATITPPQSSDIPLALWEEYLKDESSYSSCHDIAAMLLLLCGDGDAVVTRGEVGVRAAQAALGNRNLIILRSTHPTGDGHSVPLFVRDGWVETIEGWAGRTRRDCSPLHACLFNDEAPIWVSTADASRALGQLLADTVDLRLAAWSEQWVAHFGTASMTRSDGTIAWSEPGRARGKSADIASRNAPATRNGIGARPAAWGIATPV